MDRKPFIDEKIFPKVPKDTTEKIEVEIISIQSPNIFIQKIFSDSLLINWKLQKEDIDKKVYYLLDVSEDNFKTYYRNYKQKIITTNKLLLTNLKDNTNYYFRIKAVYKNITSEYSNKLVVKTKLKPPTAISSVNITSSSFTSRWNLNNADGYILELSTDINFTNLTYNIDVGNIDNYTFTNLLINQDYYFRVKSYTQDNISDYSNIITTTTILGSPVLNSANSITSNSFNIGWNNVPSATQYKIDVSTNNSFSNFVGIYNNYTVLSTNINIIGLNSNTNYYVRVRAENLQGISSNSNVVNVETNIAPPNNLTVDNVTSTTSRIKWDNYSIATSYLYDVSENNFSTYIIQNKSINQTITNPITDIVNGLTPNTLSYYRVRSVKNLLISDYSSVFTITSATVPPVQTSSTNIDVYSFTANWNSVIGATGYVLEYSNDNFITTNIITIPSNATLSYNITSLSANTEYKTRVKAKNIDNIYSNYSNIITTTTLTESPVITSITNLTDTKLTVNWSSPVTVQYYTITVSLDNTFTNILSSYNNLNIGTVLSYDVYGLTQNTTYYIKIISRLLNNTILESNIVNELTLSPSLIYILNENTGNIFNDSSINNNDGTVLLSPPYYDLTTIYYRFVPQINLNTLLDEGTNNNNGLIVNNPIIDITALSYLFNENTGNSLNDNSINNNDGLIVNDPIIDNSVFYYLFNENTGNILNDNLSNNNDGLIVNNSAPDNSVFYYLFNENTGNILNDNLSNNNDGLIVSVNLNVTNLRANYYFNNLNDSSGNNNTLIKNGEALLLNHRAYFQNNNIDRIYVPYQVLDSLNDFTISFWYQTELINTNKNTILSCSNASTINQFNIYYNKIIQQWVVSINNVNYSFITNTTVENLGLNHYCIQRQGSTLYLYINNVLIDSFTAVSSTIDVQNGYCILGQLQNNLNGGFNTNESLTGNIDNLFIYSDFLNSTDRTNLYNFPFN